METSNSTSRQVARPGDTNTARAEDINWIKTETRWTVHVRGKITPDFIQSILADTRSTLNDEERSLFIKARSEIAKEWDFFLENATVNIFTDRKTYVITSGDRTNILHVQKVEGEPIQANWSGGTLRPFRNVIWGIGSLVVQAIPQLRDLIYRQHPRAIQD